MNANSMRNDHEPGIPRVGLPGGICTTRTEHRRMDEGGRTRLGSVAWVVALVGILWSAVCASRAAQAIEATGATQATGAGGCLPVAAGLADWWRGEGDGSDAQGTNHAVLKNGAGFAPGMVGQGFVFDGVDDYVEVPGSGLALGTGDFTVEGWAKMTAKPDLATLFSFGPWEPGLYVGGNGTFIFYFGGLRGRGTNAPLNDGQFHHFAAVRREGVLSLYQDGRPAGTIPFPDSIQRSPFLLGWDQYPGDYFPGVLDEIALHRRSLGAEEVQELHAAGALGRCVENPNGPALYPALTGLEPPRGVPGTVVVLRGRELGDTTRLPQVEFNGISAAVLRAGPTEILTVVPEGLAEGTAAIRVRVAGTTSEGNAFRVDGTEPVALSAARLDGGIVVAWPVRAGMVQLESTASLAPPGEWRDETNAAVVIGESVTVTVGVPRSGEGAGRYFRLRPATASSRTGSATIAAVPGGAVVLPGGSTILTVPPGSLAQDTRIEVVEIAPPAHPELPFARDYVFSPAGLAFRSPATLSIPLPPGIADPNAVEIVSLSEANDLVRSGVETSQLRPVTNAVYDAASRSLRVPVEHFSVLSILYRRSQDEIVFDIPGRYLKKGDLIYTLTSDAVFGGRGWIPGHCGMFLGTTDALSPANDGVTIVESTSADTSKDGRFGGYRDGVQVRTDFGPASGAFKILSGQHLYMGARRPRPEPTDEERDRIAEWVLDQVGKPYASLGGTFLSSGESGLSCVGLTERAYEVAGKNIVPGWRETPLMPARQFAYTEPVTEVTMTVGERYVMDVYGVRARTLREYEKTRFQDYDLRLTADPEGQAGRVIRAGRARLSADPQDFQEFVFTPGAEDGDLAYAFRFTLADRSSGTEMRTRAFLIHVRERPAIAFVRQDPPVIRVSTFLGTGSATNLMVTDREALTRGPDGSPLRLFWEPPPARIVPGIPYSFGIQADAGSNPPEVTSSASAPPRLIAGISQFPDEFGPSTAFVGYQSVANCSSSQSGFCFRRVERPYSETATVPAEAREAADFRGVTLYFRLFRSFGPFNPGEIRGTLEWNYLPAP